MEPLLQVDGLQKSYGDRKAVDGVSFSINAGETFGLLGPNGAGKSTTVMMIAGLLGRDAGTVSLRGEPVDARAESLRRTLGLVPQNLAVYPDLSAGENLAFFGRLYGLRGRRLKERINEALERTGLSDRAKDAAGGFSGGMKRRLNFGIALLHRPELLILDEPTVGVDPQSRAHLLSSVRELSREGVAVIYVSHYMEEVQALCECVGIIDHGQMIKCGRISELLSETAAEVRMTVRGRLDYGGVNGTVHIDQSRDETRVVVRRDPQRNLGWERAFGDVMQEIARSGNRISSIETAEPNLEQLFLNLTGSRLRD